MSLKHGVNAFKDASDISSAKIATVGIPFFIGAWPCHAAGEYTGKPQIALNFEEAKKLGGYSTDWRESNGNPRWSLCQAMYAQFKINNISPAIFYNIFNPATHKTAVTAAEVSVVDHIAKLPYEAIDSTALVVKTSDESSTLVKDTDYEVYYDDSNCIVELISDGSHYSETALNIAYDKADPTLITSSDVEAAVENVEMCRSILGTVPDLICAPGWSQTPSVAAVMAVKAANINGVFKAKAVVDLDTSSSGADSYTDVPTYKSTSGYTDENMIVCWPLVKNGDYLFDLSTIVCGLIANVDASNGNCPFESPSNKSLNITGACLKDGTEVNLSYSQADTVTVTAGAVTAINDDGWVMFGNYTGCWPACTDVAKCFICTSRMQDWLCNTFNKTYRRTVDRPLDRVLIDAVVNPFNIFLSGLTHDGKLLGGKIEYVAENNSAADLASGAFRLDAYAASPVPAQRIDMHLKFSISILNDTINNV